ncbi:hypothetical protein LWI28_024795 [Acer negundo]|uniref:Uncharacterized protein n=1 Tax=Acer negundo TaxID=4023 RepID=A0AAD5JAS8_ACENE|nr:hypothetical protein LWI28_024795 [Acer negundo]
MHPTLGPNKHVQPIEQTRPLDPRRLQSEDHVHWFDGSDNEVCNPYRPTKAYPRLPEKDEFPRDFRRQQMAHPHYNFDQPRAHDDTEALTKRVKALEFETYFSFPSTPRQRPNPFENSQPPRSTSLESASSQPRTQGIKSFKPGSNLSSHTSSNSQIEYFNYHAKGHIASRCPTRTLALTKEIDKTPIDEQGGEIVEPLEDYDDLGLDDLVGDGIGLLGVIRCIPTCESDSESLCQIPSRSSLTISMSRSFGHNSSYTIARICLEPLPTP